MKRYFVFIIIIIISTANFAAEEILNEKPLFIQTEKIVKKDIFLSKKFLSNKTHGKRMFYSDDKDVFLTYIFILKNFAGDNKGRVKINYKDLKDYLYPDLKTKKARKKILNILNILYKKYELIGFDKHLKNDPEIKLFSLKEDLLPYKYPSIDYLVIPETLWSFEWEKRLSFTGLYVYLINLMEIRLVPFDTHWSIDPEMLALKYNLSLRQIRKGLEELQQYSLIEAFASDENNIFNNKPVVKYKTLPLYSGEDLEKEWIRIKADNKANYIKRASTYAAILYKRYDPATVEKILELMKQFPRRKLRKAFNMLDEKPVASEDRSLNYLHRVLESM